MAISWLAAFRSVPWAEVLIGAPQIVKSAKDLWANVKGQSPEVTSALQNSNEQRLEQLEQHVATLQKEASASSQIVQSLAEQNARLVETIETLRVRTKILAILSALSLIAILILGALALR